MTAPTPIPPALAIIRRHRLEWDPPHGLSNGARWTCANCRDVVVLYNGNAYGSAVDEPCSTPDRGRCVRIGNVRDTATGREITGWAFDLSDVNAANAAAAYAHRSNGEIACAGYTLDELTAMAAHAGDLIRAGLVPAPA